MEIIAAIWALLVLLILDRIRYQSRIANTYLKDIKNRQEP